MHHFNEQKHPFRWGESKKRKRKTGGKLLTLQISPYILRIFKYHSLAFQPAEIANVFLPSRNSTQPQTFSTFFALFRVPDKVYLFEEKKYAKCWRMLQVFSFRLILLFFALGRRAVFVEILTFLKHLSVNNGKHVALAMQELKLSKHTFGRLFWRVAQKSCRLR